MISSALPGRSLRYQPFVLNTVACGETSGEGNELSNYTVKEDTHK